MQSTEEERRSAWLMGMSVEQWRRLGNHSSIHKDFARGGHAIFADRRLNGDAGEADDGVPGTAAGIARKAAVHLDEYLKNPDGEEAAQSLARCAALISAALAKHGRASVERARSSAASFFRG